MCEVVKELQNWKRKRKNCRYQSIARSAFCHWDGDWHNNFIQQAEEHLCIKFCANCSDQHFPIYRVK